MIKKFLKDEDGVTLVQTIIVIPILLSLVWSGLQFGFCMYTKGKVQEAKRIGLKEMEIVGGLNQQVVDKIKDEFADCNIDISSLIIDGTPAPQQYGTNLTLRLKLDYPISLFIPYASVRVFNHKIDLQDSITSEFIIR